MKAARDVGDPTVRQELVARVQTLRADSQPTWGNMTPAVVLFHLNAAMRIALGKLAAVPVGNPAFWHSTGKAVALGEAPWPQGAPTSREALPEGDVDFELERQQFAVLLDELVARDPGGEWPDHPRLGPFTGADWRRLAYTHAVHHFRQFGI